MAEERPRRRRRKDSRKPLPIKEPPVRETREPRTAKSDDQSLSKKLLT